MASPRATQAREPIVSGLRRRACASGRNASTALRWSRRPAELLARPRAPARGLRQPARRCRDQRLDLAHTRPWDRAASLPRQRTGRVPEFGVRHRPGGPAPAQRLRRRESVAEHHQPGRRGSARAPDQRVTQPGVAGQRDPGERRGELGALARDPDVGGQGDAQPRPHAGAADGDDRPGRGPRPAPGAAGCSARRRCPSRARRPPRDRRRARPGPGRRRSSCPPPAAAGPARRRRRRPSPPRPAAVPSPRGPGALDAPARRRVMVASRRVHGKSDARRQCS